MHHEVMRHSISLCTLDHSLGTLFTASVRPFEPTSYVTALFPSSSSHAVKDSFCFNPGCFASQLYTNPTCL
eukprot:g33906.t1